MLPPTQAGGHLPGPDLHPGGRAAVRRAPERRRGGDRSTRAGCSRPGAVAQECGAGLLPIEVDRRRARDAHRRRADARRPSWTRRRCWRSVGLTADDLRRPGAAGSPAAAWSSRTCRCARTRWPAPGSTRRPRSGTASTRQRLRLGRRERRPRTPGSSCPGVGVPEDPATGSAALGLGVWLVASGLLPGDGRSAYAVRQGVEIHRPSALACTVTAAGRRGGRRDGQPARWCRSPAARSPSRRSSADAWLAPSVRAGCDGCDGRVTTRGQHAPGRRGDEEGRRGLGQRRRRAGARALVRCRWRARSCGQRAGRAVRARVWPTRPRRRSPCAVTTAVGSSPGRPG